MLQEREFEHTFQGWQDAVSILTRIGKYGPYFQILPMDSNCRSKPYQTKSTNFNRRRIMKSTINYLHIFYEVDNEASKVLAIPQEFLSFEVEVTFGFSKARDATLYEPTEYPEFHIYNLTILSIETLTGIFEINKVQSDKLLGFIDYDYLETTCWENQAADDEYYL